MPKTNAELVNAWARERVSNGPIARDTAAYNQLHAALPDLIARLDAAAAPAPAPAPAPQPQPAAKAPAETPPATKPAP